MRWIQAIGFLVVTALALGAWAAEPSKFSVTAEATQSGGNISVSIKIEGNHMENVPGAGNTLVKEELSSPRIILPDGQRGEIEIGNVFSGKKTNGSTEIDSGIRVEVISIKGQNKVIVVSTLIKGSATVWADAQTIVVKPAAGN